MPIAPSSINAQSPAPRVELHRGTSTAREAPAADGVRTFSLAVEGLAEDQCSLLRSMLGVLESRLPARWRWSDEPCPDLLLRPNGCRSDRRARLQALLSPEGASPDEPGCLLLQPPLRVMAVFDLLQAAGERLGAVADLNRSSERPMAERDDDLSLASALSRLFARRQIQALRVRVVGSSTLLICPGRGVFCSDIGTARLEDVLRGHRFVVTLLAEDSAELRASLDAALPIDGLLWSIGLATAWDRHDLEGLAFRLLRWPDFTRLPHRAEHLQACAALSARPLTLGELEVYTRLGRQDTLHFLHACELSGLLQVEAGSAPKATHAAPPVAASSGGLFQRLRRRFGL